MHMIKMFTVNKKRPDDLLPYYGYYNDNKQSIAKPGQRKRWDAFGKGSRRGDMMEDGDYGQYELGRGNDSIQYVHNKHRGISGLHTPDPSFSLYSPEYILQAIDNTTKNNNNGTLFKSDTNADKPLIVNDRLFEQALPDSAFMKAFSTIDRFIRRESDNKVGLQDIYNLPENRSVGTTGNLIIPKEYKSAFKAGLSYAISDVLDPDDGDYSGTFNNIILPHNKNYYYTNKNKPEDYSNLISIISDMMDRDEDDSDSDIISQPWLVDVNTSIFDRNDRYNKKIRPAVDFPYEMVARSIIPKKGVSHEDFYNAKRNISRADFEDREKVAQEQLGKLFDIDPIELSDDRYKNVLDNMSDNYCSDWLRLLRR